MDPCFNRPLTRYQSALERLLTLDMFEAAALKFAAKYISSRLADRQRRADIQAAYSEAAAATVTWAEQQGLAVRSEGWKAVIRLLRSNEIADITGAPESALLQSGTNNAEIWPRECPPQKELIDTFILELDKRLKALIPIEDEVMSLRTDLVFATVRLAVQGISAQTNLSRVVTTEEYFLPWTRRDILFNHEWNQVGRRTEIAALRGFLESDHPVAFLTGRGGIGKTKLLKSLVEGSSNNYEIRFVLDGGQLTESDFSSLPESPCVLVIDDAHRRGDLQVALQMIHRRKSPLKIILSSRPYGLNRMRDATSRSGFDAAQIVELPEITELDNDSVIALAREALGEQMSDAADRLAEVTGDSPLLTVIGGQLLARDDVDPRLLERVQDFRRAALDRFSEVLIGDLGPEFDAGQVKGLLALISAIAPVRVTSTQVLAAMAKFMNLRPSAIASLISQLQAAGVLLRRGRLVRITPDVLSDHILHRACITDQGATTGFAQEVYEAFAGLVPVEVLSNLSELDWRVEQAEGSAADLLDSIWSDIDETFKQASNRERINILGMLEKVAFFQPTRALKLVEFAIDNNSDIKDPSGLDAVSTVEHEDVVRATGSLLKAIAYHPEFSERGLDLLWQISISDATSTNSNPAHPLRLIGELVEYDLGKPVWAVEQALKSVLKWADSSDADQAVVHPLSLLSPLVAKTGTSLRSSGHRVTWTSFPLSLEKTGNVRTAVLEAATTASKSNNLRTTIAGLDLLEQALRDPAGLMNREITDAERLAWVDEQKSILEQFRVLADSSLHPLARLKILQAVDWHSRHSRSEDIKCLAGEVQKSIARTDDLKLVYCLLYGWFHDWWNPDLLTDPHDWDSKEAALVEIRTTVIDMLCSDYPEADNAFHQLDCHLHQLSRAGETLNPFQLMVQLGREQPGYGQKLAARVAVSPESLLVRHLASLVSGIRSVDNLLGTNLLTSLVESNDIVLQRQATFAYASYGWTDSYGEQDKQNLKKLLQLGDTIVTRAGLGALSVLGRDHPHEAVNLLMQVDPGEDSSLGKALCGIIGPRHGISMDSVSDKELIEILGKISSMDDVDDYDVAEFLERVGQRLPTAVIGFYMERITTSTRPGGSSLHALPFGGLEKSLQHLSGASEYPVLIRNIRDQMLDPNASSRWHTAHLFSAASAGFGLESQTA